MDTYGRLGGDIVRICEMRNLEVINICTGKRLGYVVDVEINLCTADVEAVIVPGPGKICGFLGVDCEYIIPCSCVKRVGKDVILVEIQEEKFLRKL